MMQERFQEFIQANRRYFHRMQTGKNSGDVMFVDAQSVDEYVLVAIMKIATAVASVLGKNMVVLPPITGSERHRAILDSFVPHKIIPFKKIMLQGFLRYFPRVFRIMSRVHTGEDLVTLQFRGSPIGIHLYDAVLMRYGISTIDRIPRNQRMFVFFELVFYFVMRQLFLEHSFSFTFLPDNTYRSGLIFERVKECSLPSIVGVNVYGVSMHKYESIQDYSEHCRTPDRDILERVKNSPALEPEADRYFAFRTSGQQKQHDLLRAYSQDKVMLERKDLIQDYALDPEKKIILVMSHIFQDAPHAYPLMFFKDYEQWLVQTCQHLAGNPRVNFLVKEHPSAQLYGEELVIDRILEKHGFRRHLLAKNVNTSSLFSAIDVLVTCGGTAGMEFPCSGVPVLVGAKPPYHAFSYVVSPDSVEGYFSELARIHHYKKLPASAVREAQAVLFTTNQLMQIEPAQFGLGTQKNYRGAHFDYEQFYGELREDCLSGKGFSNLTKQISSLLEGKNKNLLNEEKLAQFL